MSPEDLKKACEAAVERWESNQNKVYPVDHFPAITLVVKHLARGDNTRLARKSGPMSKWICNVQHGKGTVAVWDARDILRWLKK